MIRTIWNGSVHTRGFLHRYMPTNLLADAVTCTRRGLKWGVPAMLLAAPYLLIAAMCRGFIEQGGPGWLHLIVLVAIWNAVKMFWLGPVSLIRLARVRHLERKARRKAEAQPSKKQGRRAEVFLAGAP